MPAQANIEYFHNRETEERAAAIAAEYPAAAHIHLDLAERYADLALMPTELPRDAGKPRNSAIG